MSDRLNAKAAGYMELAGAKKDSDCRKVEVPGGVSSRLGCCNKFQPGDAKAREFRCGTCEYLVAGNLQPMHMLIVMPKAVNA